MNLWTCWWLALVGGCLGHHNFVAHERQFGQWLQSQYLAAPASSLGQPEQVFQYCLRMVSRALRPQPVL